MKAPIIQYNMITKRCTSCSKMFKSTSSGPSKVVYSGIQPTDVPHIGNYLGAIKNWSQLQHEENTQHIYCIVDLHSITVPKKKEIISSNITSMMASLLACGLDPQHSIIYKQSDVNEQTQLMWLFSSLVSTVRLNRFPQWKEKSKDLADTLGLFSYPVLQAADILLYNTTHVPVGDDQAVHVHLTNEIADKFNKHYGDTFQKVHILKSECSLNSRVLSLRDPTSKMSKSTGNYMSRINITDDDQQIWIKIRKSITDCTSQVTFDPENRPGVSNLVAIHSGFSGMTPEEICKKAEDLNTGQYKMAVAECVIEAIRPIRSRYEELMTSELNYLHETLQIGGEKAKEIATITWERVKENIGLSLTSSSSPSRSLKKRS